MDYLTSAQTVQNFTELVLLETVTVSFLSFYCCPLYRWLEGVKSLIGKSQEIPNYSGGGPSF